jgi:hypothetical protein
MRQCITICRKFVTPYAGGTKHKHKHYYAILLGDFIMLEVEDSDGQGMRPLGIPVPRVLKASSNVMRLGKIGFESSK